jgi:hypothetical protein
MSDSTMSGAAPAKAVPHRTAAIRRIHVGARALGLSEQARRDLQRRVTGKSSCAEMTDDQLDAVVDELRRLGAWGRPPPPARWPVPDTPQQAKIVALWFGLYHMGALDAPSEQALNTWVQRQIRNARPGGAAPDDGGPGNGIADWRALDTRLADRVIRSLRLWCERVGFRQPKAAEVRALDAVRLRAGRPPGDEAIAGRVSLLEAQWRRLAARRAAAAGDAGPPASAGAGLTAWLRGQGLDADHRLLDAAALDQAISRLGAELRRTAP